MTEYGGIDPMPEVVLPRGHVLGSSVCTSALVIERTIGTYYLLRTTVKRRFSSVDPNVSFFFSRNTEIPKSRGI